MQSVKRKKTRKMNQAQSQRYNIRCVDGHQCLRETFFRIGPWIFTKDLRKLTRKIILSVLYKSDIHYGSINVSHFIHFQVNLVFTCWKNIAFVCVKLYPMLRWICFKWTNATLRKWIHLKGGSGLHDNWGLHDNGVRKFNYLL